MTAHGVRRMLKRRLQDAGLPGIISPHSFCVMVVTDLLGQDVPMEDVQYLAGHSNPQTTQIYDRRSDLPPRTSPPSKLDSEPFEVHSKG